MSHGPVMLDVEGPALTEEDRERLRHPAAGGVILFSRNFESVTQVTALIREIHLLREPRLLVAVDQEGGRVQRFREGFTPLPPAAWYGNLYRRSREQGLDAAREAGWLMAAELRACGVDFSFAPVLDVESGVSQVIGDRAFADRPEAVAALAQAWAHGARQAGMSSVGKHFPGHGGVAADSHLSLPVDERDFDDLRARDLEPFRRMIEAGLEAIMPAHVVYPAVDDQPAGFSRRWLVDILRKQMGFNGVIFSDDLSMAAAEIAGGFGERAELALAAGCDMLLVCNQPQAADEILEKVADPANPVSQARLVRMHGRTAVDRQALRAEPRWRSAVALVAGALGTESLELRL